jgi:hypothetical protein
MSEIESSNPVYLLGCSQLGQQVIEAWVLFLYRREVGCEQRKFLEAPERI